MQQECITNPPLLLSWQMQWSDLLDRKTVGTIRNDSSDPRRRVRKAMLMPSDSRLGCLMQALLLLPLLPLVLSRPGRLVDIAMPEEFEVTVSDALCQRETACADCLTVRSAAARHALLHRNSRDVAVRRLHQ